MKSKDSIKKSADSLESVEVQPLPSTKVIPLTTSPSQPTLSKVPAKSIFASKTLWGIIFTAIASVAPIVGDAVEEGKLSVENTVKLVVILCGTGTAVVGRVQAKESIYTPDWAPGPNQSDFVETPKS